MGLVTWAASIADSIVGTLDSAAVTLYRLNSDHPGANDSLEVAPLTRVLERVRGDVAQPGAEETLGRPGG